MTTTAIADHAAHAFKVHALAWIRTYALTHPQFTSEECRTEYDKLNFPKPYDGRAWAPIYKAAEELRIITRLNSVAPKWQSNTYLRAA